VAQYPIIFIVHCPDKLCDQHSTRATFTGVKKPRLKPTTNLYL